MSILSSIYASTTSLFSFSRALNLISDNVANLNTVGFRASDALFEPIAGPAGNGGVGGALADSIGDGTQFRGGGRRLTAGEIRETGNSSDLAIRGEGYFVLKGERGFTYTRAGQFQIDDKGRLFDPISGGVLQALQNGKLSDLSVDLNKINPPSKTTGISFTGTLAVTDTTNGGTTDTYTADKVTAFDADGIAHTLTTTFTKQPADQTGVVSIKVDVKDENGATLTSPADIIKFAGTGSPAPGFNTVQITVGSGANASIVTLDFGDSGGLDGVRYLSASSSSVTAKADDGYGIGQLTSYDFDSTGALTLKFSNSQSEVSNQLALASFANADDLDTTDGRIFTAGPDIDAILSKPSENGLGILIPKNVELANVELSKEFADIIILQRGYQASSQILNVTNKMIEDVYNGVSGRNG